MIHDPTDSQEVHYWFMRMGGLSPEKALPVVLGIETGKMLGVSDKLSLQEIQSLVCLGMDGVEG